MPNINQSHLEPFLTMACPGEWQGHDLATFSARFTSPIEETRFSNTKLTREILKQAAGLSEREISSRWLVRAILAWGGMRYAAIANVEAAEGNIADLVTTIRRSHLSRKEAFDAFSALAASSPIGMGPAYFTKLIFFADPKHDGYIMDQWTGKSANLLCNIPLVKMDGNRVSPRNTGEGYEAFCTFIEDLANLMKSTHPDACGEFVENCMFAGSITRAKKDGTGGPSPWRRYVRRHG